MCILDIIILGFIAVGIVVGLCRGFFKELVGTAGLIIAIVAANWLAPMGQGYGLALVTDEKAALVLAWIVVFIVAMLIMKGLAHLMTKAMKAVSLGWLNRLAGGVFSGMKYFILVALLVCLFNLLSDKFEGFVLKPYMEESQLVPSILRIAETIWKMF